MGRAPDHVAFRAGHKVGGNVRAGNLHRGDVFLLAHFIFNFFPFTNKRKKGVSLFSFSFSNFVCEFVNACANANVCV
jgi:hypothetical protein